MQPNEIITFMENNYKKKIFTFKQQHKQMQHGDVFVIFFVNSWTKLTDCISPERIMISSSICNLIRNKE